MTPPTHTVRITYREQVRGEWRRYEHDMTVEAQDPEDARLVAAQRFYESEREALVGWERKVESVRVVDEGERDEAGEMKTLT